MGGVSTNETVYNHLRPFSGALRAKGCEHEREKGGGVSTNSPN